MAGSDHHFRGKFSVLSRAAAVADLSQKINRLTAITTMPLSRDQIAALPDEQLAAEYERSKLELDSLLKILETDNAKKVILAESITRARMSYVLLRSRVYPEHHFSEISTADLLPAK